MRRFIQCIPLTFFVLIANFAIAQKNLPEIDGFVRQYTGVLLEPPNEYSIIQNTLDLELSQSKGDIGFYANPFLYHYRDNTLDFDLREAYLDLYTKNIDFRIGKQQIIWGKADGVFITDVVSPKNLREFLLWDFSEIRMGVTAVNTEYYFASGQSLTFVWIPVFSPTKVPPEGSIWRTTPDFPVEPTFNYSQKEPALHLENSEYFARYSLSKSAVDVDLMGGYTWDDDPTMHVSRQIDTATMQLSGLKVTPQHHRLGLAGGSFSTEIKGFILRGEGAWYFDKYFNTEDPGAIEGVVTKDYLNYVVGIDKFIGEWKLSAQFIQDRIHDYEEPVMQNKMRNTTTLLINRTLFREKVRLELFSYVGIDDEDALIRFRGYFYPHDGFSIELGTNLFVGEKGRFGQYDKNDMVYSKVKYNF